MKKKTKVLVVMPAFNAEKTLEKTVADIPTETVDEIILVDDGSQDNTIKIAKKLGLTTYTHPNNLGYGGNQKTCYWEAFKRNPDVVVMIHPDYQYDATLIPELIRPIIQKRYDFMFGSRIRSRAEALKGGMPQIKYIFNRLYTLIANIILGVNFTEHMSGMRAFSKKALKTIPFQRFSNDFVFDQQMTVSAISYGLQIGEIPIPVRYYSESSSIQMFAGAKFLFESFSLLVLFSLHKLGVIKSKLFNKKID